MSDPAKDHLGLDWDDMSEVDEVKRIWRVTMVVEMDVATDTAEGAFEYAHHEATRNSDFTCVESFDPVEVVGDG